MILVKILFEFIQILHVIDIWLVYGDIIILLSPTCKINYVKMQNDYVNMQLIYVNMQQIYVEMQHNSVDTWDNYVNIC